MDKMPYSIKQKIKKLNRLVNESSKVHRDLENELEKYGFDIELFMLTSSEADVFKQSEDLSNILNGQISDNNIQETISNMERIFLIHARDKVN